MDRLSERHLIHRHRHHVASGVATGAGVRNLIEQLQDRPAVDVAGEIGHVRRHQYGHRKLVQRQVEHGGVGHGLVWGIVPQARAVTPAVQRASHSVRANHSRLRACASVAEGW